MAIIKYTHQWLVKLPIQTIKELVAWKEHYQTVESTLKFYEKGARVLRHFISRGLLPPNACDSKQWGLWLKDRQPLSWLKILSTKDMAAKKTRRVQPCRKHTEYQGIRAPRTSCPACHEFYFSRIVYGKGQ